MYDTVTAGAGVDVQRNVYNVLVTFKGVYTLPRIVTSYRDSVDGTRDRVTYQKLVTR
jgi:hypothetical protein